MAFPTAEDRTFVFGLIGSCARRFGWELWTACVLSTHYHLVVDTPVAALSKGMQALNWTYALEFNKRYRKFGHVFAERFKSKAIEDETRVFETCTYVLLNPVKAGLCAAVEEWPWSYSRYGLYAS